MSPSVALQNWSTRERSNLRKIILAAGAAALVVSLSACDQIPSLNPADQTANKAACDSISSTWNTLSTALGTGNIMTIAQAVQVVPGQVDAALKGATDKQLIEAMNSLKSQATSIIGGAQPDLTAIAAAGVGISGRCTILGSAASIQLPKIG